MSPQNWKLKKWKENRELEVKSLTSLIGLGFIS